MLKTRSPGLGNLLNHARKLSYLDQKLASLLEPALSEQVQVAALHDGCLVIITPSAALATRLRMDSESLLRAIQNTGVKDVNQIRIRTAPLSRAPEIRRRKRKLPEIARQSLERFAQDSGDEELLEKILKGDSGNPGSKT